MPDEKKPRSPERGKDSDSISRTEALKRAIREKSWEAQSAHLNEPPHASEKSRSGRLRSERERSERELDAIIEHFERGAAEADAAVQSHRPKKANPAVNPPEHSKNAVRQSRSQTSSRPIRHPAVSAEKKKPAVPSREAAEKSGKKRPQRKKEKALSRFSTAMAPYRKAWHQTAFSRWTRQVRLATDGMRTGEKARYLVGQIGPVTRAVRSDPVCRERAYQILIWVLALLLAMHMISCVNDVMGFNRSSKVRNVHLDPGMTTNQVVGRLDRAGLIKHSTFCKLFLAAFSTVGDRGNYLAGDFGLSRNMGVENMLIECQGGRNRNAVQVTFPEGYNIEQMAALLEKNKVCSREDFRKAADSTSYHYDFVRQIDSRSKRYHALEGYLYPDTYEFYQGEPARDVVNAMLRNFSRKWTADYAAQAKARGMTVDEVVRLASIVQKEDSRPANMKIISSVFQNRLRSSRYPYLQSDATNFFVKTYIKPHVSASEYARFWSLYSTYRVQGLPVGAIGSPGEEAIRAVLWPESSPYYFFIHNKDGDLYVGADSRSGMTLYAASDSSNSTPSAA